MPIELVQPSLIVTGAALMFIILVFAVWSERYGNEDVREEQGVFVAKQELKDPAEQYFGTYNFCVWWTPEELAFLAEQAKMATPEGRHPVKDLNIVLNPSIADRQPQNQEGDSHDRT